nr:MAG TPA: hemolysin [Caudoviricetes sp.]
MPAEVITAALSLVGTLVGTLGGIALSSNLTNYRIEQLEKKVEKHNNLITRTYKLEQEFAVMDEKVKVANHRINDLEDLEHES